MATDYLNARPRHPAALGIAVALHVGVVAALIAFNPKIVREVITYMPTDSIKAETPPPIPVPKPPKSPDIQQRDQQRYDDERLQQSKNWVDITPPQIPIYDGPMPQPPICEGTSCGGLSFDPPLTGDPAPSLTQAMMTTRAGDIQPPYPAALQRAEIEGSVTVRLDIASDGRVVGVTLLNADDPAFFAATRDWAMKHWRFKPATRDGTAIATTLVKRVVFRIER